MFFPDLEERSQKAVFMANLVSAGQVVNYTILLAQQATARTGSRAQVEELAKINYRKIHTRSRRKGKKCCVFIRVGIWNEHSTFFASAGNIYLAIMGVSDTF